MSQNRRSRAYSRVRDALIRDLRQSDGTPSVVAGYLPGNAGRPKPHPGDEKFPFVKDPPDTEGPVRYIEPVTFTNEGTVENPIPRVTDFADYLTLQAIDVAPFRLLKLFIEFFPADNGGANDGMLAIVPEQSLGDQDEWFPAGVVEGVITPTGITGYAGGERRTFSTQLMFNSPGSGVVVPASIRETLDFDVTTSAQFRLLVGDTLQTRSGLNLWYQLNR